MLIEAQWLLYMKVGSHAGEPLSKILRRKSTEIKKTGFCLWGYGGSCCHPHTQVIPHCIQAENSGENVKVCMDVVKSAAIPKIAEQSEYSRDGGTFKTLPSHIKVTGSKWALVISAIDIFDGYLDLSQYEIAVGSCMGRIATKYLKGRVDKACLRRSTIIQNTVSKRKIQFLATLQFPYAVYVR